MTDKKQILLTPASEMTWGKRKPDKSHGLQSPNEEKRVKIYTPGETAPIMTTAVNH